MRNGDPSDPIPVWIARFARWFEPYGILIAVAALGVALMTLWVEIDLRRETLTALAEEANLRNDVVAAMREEKVLRDATLTALGQEKLLREESLVALEQDKVLREAVLYGLLIERIADAHENDAPYAGHVPILERLVRLNMDLVDVDLTGLRFDVDEGLDVSGGALSRVNFRGSRLEDARFAGADLTRAEFRDANLRGADFGAATLHKARFRSADLKAASLRDADVSGAYFRYARGLTQQQLDSACAQLRIPPRALPFDYETGAQLVWRPRVCPTRDQ